MSGLGEPGASLPSGEAGSVGADQSHPGSPNPHQEILNQMRSTLGFHRAEVATLQRALDDLRERCERDIVLAENRFRHALSKVTEYDRIVRFLETLERS